MVQLTEQAAQELKKIRDEMQEQHPGSVPRLFQSGEVLRDDTGQVVWSKFVPWGRWNRRQDEFEEAARKQELIARQSTKGGR